MSKELEGIPSDIILWVRAKMNSASSLEEIITSIKEKFPTTGNKINPARVRKYILSKDPDWEKKRASKEPEKEDDDELPEPPEEESELAQNVKQEVEKLGDWEPNKEFSRDEKEKLDMLHGHRVILNEHWFNYMKIRDSRAEAYKKGYLEAIARELDAIQKLESAERDLMSALEEVRVAEEKEPPEKVLDNIIGWKIKRLLQKCSDEKQASELIDKLSIELLNISIDLKIGNNKNNTIKRLEDRLYEEFKSPP